MLRSCLRLPALAALFLGCACGAPFVGVAPSDAEAGATFEEGGPNGGGGRSGLVVKPTLGGSESEGGSSTALSGAASVGGDSSGAAGDGGSSEPGGCPELGGAKLVLAGSFCIDESEVTVAHYRAFLDELPSVLDQPAPCAGNATFANNCKSTSPEKEPQRCVDWCDARAYCDSVGKRLCGASEGGAVAFDAPGDASDDQWFAACSHGGTRAYPYGGEYDGAACWGGDKPTVGVLTVKSASGCVGGYDGLWDMSGGLAEWVDSCSAETGGTDACRIRGGSSSGTGEQLRCDAVTATARGTSSSYIGFRCCAELSP